MSAGVYELAWASDLQVGCQEETRVREQEFRAFFLDMHPRVLRYALRQLDPETANEVCVDVMRVMWAKGLAAPRDEADRRRLESLCYRVCKGLIRNALRAEARRRKLDEELLRHTNPSDSVACDIADRVADDAAVAALLRQVPVRDREVLSLLADGYKTGEIAIALGVSADTATMRISRAKKRLARTVERAGKEASVAIDD
jgi:RNA polymerase sigma-70 factor (ECF subfamily)